MRRRGDRGVALVWAVAIVAVLTSIALAVGRASLGTRDAFRQLVARAQADALLRSSVALASVALEAHVGAGDADTLQAPWASPHRRRIGPGWIDVTIEDLGRRIDVNAEALRPVLARLARRLDVSPTVVAAIADWIDADDDERRGGAEARWYTQRRTGVLPPNAPFTSLHHLTLVRDVTPAVLARLAPYLTAEGDAGLNPNTAPPAVLDAWLGDAVRVASILDTREHGTIDCVGLQHCTLHSRRFLLHVRAGVDVVERDADVVLLTAPGLPATIERWEPPVAGPSGAGGRQARRGDRLAELP